MIDLAHDLVRAKGAEPQKWLLYLHGILGTRANWRGIARRVCAERPEWGAVLVDLRHHGDSQGTCSADTVTASAEDLFGLDAVVPGPIAGVLGHSFGGKVALAYAARRGASSLDPGLEELWLIDSAPGARPERAGSEIIAGILETLRTLRFPMAQRRDFLEALARAGLDDGLAQWLAMNLGRRDDGAFDLRLDLEGIEAMLADYFSLDLWSVVEEPKAERTHLVIGGASEVFGEADRDQARSVAEAERSVSFDVIEGAGHWVHAEAPEALIALLVEGLRGGAV